jgi:glutathione-regulated potassium-efflux system ancillary protein KefG
MARVLVQFAHPLLEKSRVQKQMLKQANLVKGVTLNDLYERYPDFDIDVKREQRLLLAHDIIIFQHPFYWYSTPAIVKQWLDLVLEHGWAYGAMGDKLKGKLFMQAITCGGSELAYQTNGRNRFTIRQMLAPMDQTANLCQMEYLPPFVVFGTHKLKDADIAIYALEYGQILSALNADRIQKDEWKSVELMNELCPFPESLQS